MRSSELCAFLDAAVAHPGGLAPAEVELKEALLTAINSRFSELNAGLEALSGEVTSNGATLDDLREPTRARSVGVSLSALGRSGSTGD